MEELPEWVRRQKTKGTEVRRMAGGVYYLYKVSSVWDPAKGRARKITERYLGKLTPHGLVGPKHDRMLEMLKEVSVKEFGASSFMIELCSDVIELVRRYYPEAWEEMIVLSMIRLFHSSPLKNVVHHYGSSHLSDAFPEANVSPRSLSTLLSSIGMRRERAVAFMKNFIGGKHHEHEHAVIDLTHIFSLSEGVITATLGHNADGDHLPQVNFILILSLDKMRPSFFRLVPGSIGDVSIIAATLREAWIESAVLIGDKGFYSSRNASFLEEGKLRYVLPLKRSSSLIDYSVLRSGNKRELDGYFLFERRVVWYSERKIGDARRVILFLDDELGAEEQKDFISHVDDGKLTIREYYRRQFSMGTIAVITNCEFKPRRVFELLKSRVNIEQLFDTLKNTLHSDRSYMRDDAHLQGWMFINFISLLMYYRVYELLLRKELLDRHTPKDVVLHLSRVYKLRVGDRWFLSEIPKASRVLAQRLGIELHIT